MFKIKEVEKVDVTSAYGWWVAQNVTSAAFIIWTIGGAIVLT